MASANSNANVYGGDEINAIILDPGSLSTRIGYAGDDFPKIITPSYYAANGKKHIFGDSINVPRADFDIKPILKDSVIEDWDAAIEQYHHYFDKELALDYKEQPIFITEPIWTSAKQRQTLVENIYEKFDFPALYLGRAPTCVSFQQGRPNCLVVNIGHDTVSVTAVIDGISLLKNSMRTHYSGQYLSDQLYDLFLNKFPSLTLDAKYKIRTKTPTKYPEPPVFTPRELPKNITKSFDDYQKELLFHEMKETLLEAPDKQITDENSESYSKDENRRAFELPNGQSIELAIERYEMADSLFEPNNYSFTNETLANKYSVENGSLTIDSNQDDYRPLKRARKNESNQSTPPPAATEPSVAETRGLTQLISHVLSTIDIDLRASVAHNIIVTGGASLIPQVTERLYSELSSLNPGLKIRLHAVGNSSERVNQAWIGASVLASLGTFHQMWVTKEEYDEAGPDKILNQRFR
ncbi:NuA4 histone acetyltransferase subunit [Yamadazyma tenuis]|uniref:Actin-related protein 4 n=1 Tax=Candida tenuis (strain ATCC 10573 / BCRC 21748 / CBS 615 / JCM 9827 / NBRC 10315 / NRRL Y-1498 / VKM Y-70) TaxID=590646 RepID=G3B8I2_CANTC|nr:Actin/actin-like protein [Yamadazyma tenuis ATCC 10573]EGV61738.1 Actin/actin-like protein [Yamadazyma tenuis ATCC 10573]WEJ92967.1 NuA4 histone acetyltransferase subunit [Yamadazyma tenuis]